MLDKILSWFGVQIPALFAKYGWKAALIVIVVVAVLGLGAVIALRQWGIL